MPLTEQQQILNYLLRKNPDATIKDYIQIIKEFTLLRAEVENKNGA